MAKTIDILKNIQADCAVFHIKLHNYHWNVKGMDFYPVHAALEVAYDDIADLMDDAAERILQIGGKPLVTIADMLKASKIKEEKKDSFDSKTIAKATLADYEHFLANFKALSEAADADGDKGTVGFADENIAKLEKKIWMIKAQLA